MNAAIYIRWSTDDQGTGTTLDEQRESCLRWASEKGLTVLPHHIFVDDGVSGAKESRPALNRLNRAVQDGTISVVIVYKLDRLARKPYLAYKLVEKDWLNRASLVSVTEAHIDTTTTVGQLGFGIAAVFAAHERNTIRDRTMSGKRRRAAEGRNPGLRPPFGYQISDKRFVVTEGEAAIVRRIYADYLSGGTVGQIARALNEAGFRTRAGGRWHISAVQRVLTNQAYKGTLVYRDITAEQAFPIIIDAQSWAQAQAIRTRRARTHPRRLASESPYLLSGRLFCSQCGRPMNGRVSRNGKHENRYYACTGNIQFRDCECPSVRQEVLEQAVVANLLQLLDEQEIGRRVRTGAAARFDLLRQEAAALEARLRELDRELHRVRQDYRQQRFDAHTFNALHTEIESERASLAARLTRRRLELVRTETDATVAGATSPTTDLLHVWEELSFALKREVIHLLTERIVWDWRAHRLTVHTCV